MTGRHGVRWCGSCGTAPCRFVHPLIEEHVMTEPTPPQGPTPVDPIAEPDPVHPFPPEPPGPITT